MPTNEQILIGLAATANTWKAVAVFWHVYFGVIAILLLSGIRPQQRVVGLLLGLPLLSVSVAAWAFSNPFNGVLFAVIGGGVLYISARLPRENCRIPRSGVLVPGIFLFLFGWLYPHFLATSSFLSYVYAAPTGLIPCPTLSITIGLALIVNSLQSRALSLVLGVVGLFYGITGGIHLGVAIDGFLLLGAAVILLVGFQRRIS